MIYTGCETILWLALSGSMFRYLAKQKPDWDMAAYAAIKLIGGVLFRTKTLAGGDGCCDFYICRMGSKWGVERAKEGDILR